MSRAVSSPEPLSSILATIAAKAAELIGGRAAGILLLDGHGSLRFAGHHGLSAEYRERVARIRDELPVAETFRSGHAVVISDTESDPRFKPWLAIARRSGYRSLVAVPLSLGGSPIGVLTVYRGQPGDWSASALSFVELIGAHAASAVRTAELIDEQKHRLAAYSRAVRGLREQTANHVAQLQTLLETLETGNSSSVSRIVSEFKSEHEDMYAAIAERIHCRVLASVLLGEASIASQRDIQLRLDHRSRLDSLPRRLDEIETVSIVSNLLDNAFYAVARVSSKRRRVTLLIHQDSEHTIFSVRDWGVGLGNTSDAQLLEHGFTTKDGHAGAGLGLVAQVAEAAGGRVAIRRPAVGATFTVTVPND